MSNELQLLRSLVPTFQALNNPVNGLFAAVARVPAGTGFDDAFLQQFFQLSDRTVTCPDAWNVRTPTLIQPSGKQQILQAVPPEQITLFTGKTYDEFLLLDSAFSGTRSLQLRDLGATAWKVMPNGLKEAYKPLHNLGVSWRPWRPEPTWEWLYFVFRQLSGQGDLVRRQRLGDLELIYFTVGVFQACALAATAVAEAGDNSCRVVPRWDSDRQELWLSDELQRRYYRRAPTQFLVLDAFQMAGWPLSIPAPESILGVKDAVEGLNDRLENTSRLRFRYHKTEHAFSISWHLTPV